MMPERCSADGTAGYDPMIFLYFLSALSLCYPVFVLFLASAQVSMGITILHLASRYYVRVFEQSVALGSWTGRVHRTGL
jgi:hypothetical protein